MKQFLLSIAFVFTSLLSVYSQADIPKVNALLVDEANILSSREFAELERDLIVFDKNTSNQILVFIAKDLRGYDVSDFAFRLGEKNGVGQAGFDNGIVVVVKPKVGSSRGKAFIATGYGLEGAIPDITAKQIIENEMIPYFKQNKYGQGIAQGLNTLKALAKGEINHKQIGRKNKKGILSGLFTLLFIGFIFSFAIFRRVRRYASTNNMGFWAAWALMNASNNRHNGFFNDFNSGGGSFGGGSGFGGGGFGGFGGGSFGGGGAGGSW